MRGFLMAAVVFGAVSAAQAADLPILRGGFTDGYSSGRVNWQGFYVGGQYGYGSSDENFNGSANSMLAALVANNVILQQMGVASWYHELRQVRRACTSGFGAFAGYNWQWDDVVIGSRSELHARNGFKAPRPLQPGPLDIINPLCSDA